jgi:hypothetical protein
VRSDKSALKSPVYPYHLLQILLMNITPTQPTRAILINKHQQLGEFGLINLLNLVPLIFNIYFFDSVGLGLLVRGVNLWLEGIRSVLGEIVGGGFMGGFYGGFRVRILEGLVRISEIRLLRLMRGGQRIV